MLLPEHAQLKDWIAFFACTGFFIMIHIVLEIPATDGAGPWLAYAALIVVQGLGSVLVDTTLPLVLTAICTFVLAWKVAVGRCPPTPKGPPGN